VKPADAYRIQADLHSVSSLVDALVQPGQEKATIRKTIRTTLCGIQKQIDAAKEEPE
jgi:hypothetical protein